MRTFNAGRLRHRITLERLEHTVDPDTGARSKDWVEVAKVWAEISPLSARDFVQANALQSKVTARITIRYRPDITADMRILHGDKIYNIAGVLPDNKSGQEYITLPVSEGTNAG